MEEEEDVIKLLCGWMMRCDKWMLWSGCNLKLFVRFDNILIWEKVVCIYMNGKNEDKLVLIMEIIIFGNLCNNGK